MPYKVCTPIKANQLEILLENHPDRSLVDRLVKGFKFGFSLCYEGAECSKFALNLKSARDLPVIAWQKIKMEVDLGRIRGPFAHPPFKHFQVFPIGLVNKAGSTHPKTSHKAYRLIHHLSYGANSPEGKGVNQYIPDSLCSVKYSSFDNALHLVCNLGKGCFLAKSDLDSAFRRVPIDYDSLKLLGICINGKFFFDSTLPFGCALSCSLFKEIASALDWALVHRTGHPICHYLDDFLFCRSTYED